MRRKRLISGLQAEAGALQQPLLRGTEQAQPGGERGGEVRTKTCLRPARSHLGGCHCLCLLCRSDLAAGRSSIYSSQRARFPAQESLCPPHIALYGWIRLLEPRACTSPVGTVFHFYKVSTTEPLRHVFRKKTGKCVNFEEKKGGVVYPNPTSFVI